MVFNIEISFNLLRSTSITETELINLAKMHHSNSHYSFTEMENNYHNRNHHVYVFTFDDNDVHYLYKFIKNIKLFKDLFIECLYEDNITCKLIYASQYYLSTIDKDKVIMYKKRKRSYSDDENMLLITCKN